MGVLKNIQLSRKKFNRVDEFIELITTDIRGLEIMFSDDVRRSHGPKRKNATNLIRETWHKKKGHSQKAVYQTKPSKNPIDKDLTTLNSQQNGQTETATVDNEIRRFTPIQNLENNCWFNSVIQCFIRFGFMREHFEKDLPLSMQPVLKRVLGVAKTIYQGKTITDDRLERTLQAVCTYCGFTRGAQCDASEFFIKCPVQIVRELGKIHDATFSIKSSTKCLECHQVSNRYETGNLLQVTVSSTRFDETITSLITKTTNEYTGRVQCDKCNKVTMATVTKEWVSAPKVFMIHLLRYRFSAERRKTVKDSSFVGVGKNLQIPGLFNSQYSLSSAIQHISETAVSGHYQTLIKTRHGTAVADDCKLLTSTLHTATCHYAYICVYEKVGTTITRPRPIPNASHVIDGPSNNNLEDKHRHENSSEPNTTCEETNTATVDLTIEDDVEDSSLGRVGSKTNEDVIDLTMKDEDTDATLRQDTSNNTLIRHYGVNIVPSDIDRLLNKKGWLNDNVINCYLNILSHKAMQVSNTRVYPFTTFFYIRDGYNASSRLVKNTNIFENEIVLVPINYEFHWTLISINNKTKSFVFYDSLFSSNASFHLQSMKKYLMIELAKQHSLTV
ncbi:Sentrin-specific protease 2 [Holothuria leucospilota]|uniref:ubiquitinyl hydrolase 1 n=1 Tax=Holothuria leucospilota TaxID=206669 RepID=A0A9Q0YE97_HOLLE|nr:Sentrin-specific protease 2 [Holothuria leucospilota]